MREVINLFILILMLLATVTDVKRHEISIYILVIFSAMVTFSVLYYIEEISWGMLGGLLIGLLFFVISKSTKQAVGYGDSWMILLLGIYLGGFMVLRLLMLASFMASIVSLAYVVRFRRKKHATIPFVPFMTLAYLGVMFS